MSHSIRLDPLCPGKLAKIDSQINPAALVSVKLVAHAGVGTIAAGVAKCYADLITISGNDGGTGASPVSSIRYAGSPWELGLAEAQQTLRMNGLREKVRVQVDGGFKTGLDVVKGAMLGAESHSGHSNTSPKKEKAVIRR